MNIVCNDNLITITNLSFLAHTYVIQQTGVCHIEYIIKELSSACYIMRRIKPFMSLNALKTIYYSMVYGLPFWETHPIV